MIYHHNDQRSITLRIKGRIKPINTQNNKQNNKHRYYNIYIVEGVVVPPIIPIDYIHWGSDFYSIF